MDPWAPIEGETPIDPSDFKDKSIRTRADAIKAEAKSIRRAHVKYLATKPTRKLAPFDISWACKLHREMFGAVWVFAGQLRREDFSMGVTWTQVDSQLLDLMKTVHYRRDKTEMPLLEQAVRLHFEAVAIHPFKNGNGRWARMLTNIFLLQEGSKIVRWPEETIGTASLIRSRYLEALHAADAGNVKPLIELHRKYWEE